MTFAGMSQRIHSIRLAFLRLSPTLALHLAAISLYVCTIGQIQMIDDARMRQQQFRIGYLLFSGRNKID